MTSRGIMRLAEESARCSGELAGLAFRYQAALRLIATHGNMSAAIAAGALQNEHEHEQQHEQTGRAERVPSDVPKPEPAAEQGEKQKHEQEGAQQSTVHGSPRFWVSWFGHRIVPRAATLPVGFLGSWMSGEDPGGVPSHCALLEAPDDKAARELIEGAFTVVAWRFIYQHEAGWTPSLDRFPM